MTNYTNNLYMEQVINESGIKGNVCTKTIVQFVTI